MWIKTQAGTLVNLNYMENVFIEEYKLRMNGNISFSVMATPSGDDTFSYKLGEYTEERATEILDLLFSNMNFGAHTFTMPEK